MAAGRGVGRLSAWVGVAALAVSVAACGGSVAGSGGPAAVVLASDAPVPPSHVYAGSLTIKPDLADDASVAERSGSAGLALECSTAPYAGGGGGDSRVSAQATPEAALQDWLSAEAWFSTLPVTAYRVERSDGARTLLSYDVNGRTKIAVVAADGVEDVNGEAGWMIESWSQCDPAELPADITDALGLGIWQDASGHREPATKVRSFQGAEHCDWQDITFLDVGPGDDPVRYVRDSNQVLSQFLQSTYTNTAALPEEATDTGLSRNGQQLWLVPSQDAAYLVSATDPGSVERWPAARTPIGCD